MGPKSNRTYIFCLKFACKLPINNDLRLILPDCGFKSKCTKSYILV